MRKIRNKPIVGVDIDDTITDFVEPLLERYNNVYHDNVKFTDITDYYIKQFLKPECTNIFKEFANKQFFADTVIKEYIKNELRKLNDKYDLYFVTAGAPITIRDRDKMLSRNLDWYTSSQLIVCRDKGMLKLDYLIDDNVTNCEVGDYDGILITRPWNLYSNYNIALRVNGFNEVCNKIEWLKSVKINEKAMEYERLADEWLEE